MICKNFVWLHNACMSFLILRPGHAWIFFFAWEAAEICFQNLPTLSPLPLKSQMVRSLVSYFHFVALSVIEYLSRTAETTMIGRSVV